MVGNHQTSIKRLLFSLGYHVVVIEGDTPEVQQQKPPGKFPRTGRGSWEERLSSSQHSVKTSGGYIP